MNLEFSGSIAQYRRKLAGNTSATAPHPRGRSVTQRSAWHLLPSLRTTLNLSDQKPDSAQTDNVGDPQWQWDIAYPLSAYLGLGLEA